ncbi:PaaI family thioesterase [Actinopolyspora mortivallis]|uniref:Aromatic compound degradation protein PaaI n=1 Tax=Actinopolyspora mortivallis TaxID=33906 RepID=A0A2T0GT56_ACTMO|nr:hotdog fold thioesterase [Actinopolyspora mortivallis]PRW62223.1 aromatic compound degradation protein PaaI [Actinopolyspora mortivallis]
MAEETNGTVLPGTNEPGAEPLVSEEEQLGSRMGIEITEYDPDRVVGIMPVSGNRQPYGLLHGGANAVLAEQLGSVAAALHAGKDRIAMGLELSCTHHRAVAEGKVTGVATPLHRGNSTATYEIVVTDERGKRTCSARLTCVLRERKTES